MSVNQAELRYDDLVTAAEAAAGRLPVFQARVAPLLRQWTAPAGTRTESLLEAVLPLVSASESTAAHAQVVADALELAWSEAQAEAGLRALAAGLGAAAAELSVAQLEAAPAVLQRLADAVWRASRVGEWRHAAACEALLAVVGRLNAAMAAAADGGGVRLTRLHIECLRQCLLAQRRPLYERAMAAVVGVRFDALGSLVAPRAAAFMEFQLYGGMVCVGAGDAARAQRMWQAVFALPSKHASAIQIAAYKRLTLLALAETGRRPQPPPFFAATHARTVETHAGGYAALGDAVGARTMAAAVAKLRDLRATLDADGNGALGDRVQHALPAHFVRRVGRAYSRLPVARLVSLTGFAAHPLAEAAAEAGGDAGAALAQYIRAMGDPGVVLADGGATVVFADPAATGAATGASLAERTQREQQWAERIAEQARAADDLRGRLARVDRQLALSREHIASLRDQPAATA